MAIAGQIGFYLLFVLAAAIAAKIKFQAQWWLFFLGAVLILTTSIVGGAIGGLIVLGRPVTPYTLLVPGLIAGAFEELGRGLALWRRHLHGVGDAVMFGIGFGGAEVIERAGRLLLVVTGVVSIGVIGVASAVLCVEIFIFHVCMTLIVYRFFAVYADWWARTAIIGAALFYHVGLDFCAGRLAQMGLIYAVLVWSIATPFHLAVALRVRAESPIASRA